jgi:hypothetical protein
MIAEEFFIPCSKAVALNWEQARREGASEGFGEQVGGAPVARYATRHR